MPKVLNMTSLADLTHPETCSHVACQRAARWWPRLLVPVTSGTLEVYLALAFCERHVGKVGLEDLLVDEVWAVIVQAFAQADKAVQLPDRARCGLCLERLG